MKPTYLILITSLFLTVSCSNPLDKPYKKETLEQDIVDLKDQLTEEEFKLLSGYVVLASMSKENTMGLTYGDMLESAKELKAEREKAEKEQKELAERELKDQLDRTKRLNQALTVSLYKKDFFEYKYQEYLLYNFIFENKTDKKIKAFKGSVSLSDLFDKEIKSINLTYDNGIEPNSTAKWEGQSKFNQFIDEDVTLKNKDLEDLKITWSPEKIIFEDGSTFE